MLIDFAHVHRTYLCGQMLDGVWQFTPYNGKNIKAGAYLSSHQVFSNNGLQISLYLYNTMTGVTCTGVSHCLYLLFSKKDGAKYLLGADKQRLAFNLDLGVAGELFALAQAHTDCMSYSAIRAGKPPKRLHGFAVDKDGRRHVILRAESSVDGVAVKVEVDLDRASTIALAAHCIAYGRLLYPSLADSSVRSLLSEHRLESRACAENRVFESPSNLAPTSSPPMADDPGLTRACAENQKLRHPGILGNAGRQAKVVWAIGNQKWPRMELGALQRIQAIADDAQLQRMIDEANKGDFQSWDLYLSQ